MENKYQYDISIIIPFYNAKQFIFKNLKSLENQKKNKNFEILMIDDGSDKDSTTIIKLFKKLNIKLYSNKKNRGPSSARNLGIKNAKGRYIFFLDIDDTLDNSALEKLYKFINKKNFDVVACDKKFVEGKNKRENIYMYPTNKIFKKKDIKKLLKSRFIKTTQPVTMFDLTGKLIKTKLLIKNKIFFEEKLRYLEDECFMWQVLSKTNTAAYIRDQLYNYYINPNINTALSMAFIKNFNIKNFFIIKKTIVKSLKNLKYKKKFISKYSSHALIFFVISALISVCKSILLKKVNFRNGNKILRKLIRNTLREKRIIYALKYYKCSKDENKEIPKALVSKNRYALEQSIFVRTNEILNLRNIKS